MASKTRIVNLALARIGVSKQLTNVDTGTSKEDILGRTFWDENVAYVLRDFPWPWATTYETLSLVAGSSDSPVNNDWTFSYRYPSDCLFARRLVVSGVGRVNPTPPPFRIGRDSQGRLIYTNEETAQLEYTGLITNSEEFDSLFVSMLSWKFGADFAPSMSRIKGMAETCMQLYEIDKTKAQSRALNEGQQSEPQEAEWIAARD